MREEPVVYGVHRSPALRECFQLPSEIFVFFSKLERVLSEAISALLHFWYLEGFIAGGQQIDSQLCILILESVHLLDHDLSSCGMYLLQICSQLLILSCQGVLLLSPDLQLVLLRLRQARRESILLIPFCQSSLMLFVLLGGFSYMLSISIL